MLPRGLCGALRLRSASKQAVPAGGDFRISFWKVANRVGALLLCLDETINARKFEGHPLHSLGQLAVEGSVDDHSHQQSSGQWF